MTPAAAPVRIEAIPTRAGTITPPPRAASESQANKSVRLDAECLRRVNRLAIISKADAVVSRPRRDPARRLMVRRMRVARVSFAAVMLTTFFMLAVKESRYATSAFGQTAIAPAAVPSVSLPAAPGQPQPFATIGALPQLLPAPGPMRFASPAPSPAAQVFRCACNGPGFPTSWIGQVQAANLLVAQQNAPTSCTAYLITANAESPAIAPPSAVFNPGTQATTRFPGTLYSAPPGSLLPYQSPQVVNHPPLSAIRKLLIAEQCSRCSCN